MPDALGSTLKLTDATQASVASYSYEPYGKTTVSGSTGGSSLAYTGRENDGTGLYYYRARYYHPGVGRFVQEDPIGLDGGINPYVYVEGDPIGHIDPLGLAEIPSPNGVVPGGPWTPAPGQQPGTYYGPKVPGRPQDVCRYVPENATGTPADPYWKYKEGGTKGWERINLGGNPITPEQAHPGNGPVAPPPAVPWWVRIGVAIGLAVYSKPAY